MFMSNALHYGIFALNVETATGAYRHPACIATSFLAQRLRLPELQAEEALGGGSWTYLQRSSLAATGSGQSQAQKAIASQASAFRRG